MTSIPRQDDREAMLLWLGVSHGGTPGTVTRVGLLSEMVAAPSPVTVLSPDLCQRITRSG